MKPDWFNPRKENVYFPLPLIALFIFNIVMFLKIFGSVGRLTRFVLFYSVWCGAVGIIWYSGSAMLRYAARNRPRPQRAAVPGVRWVVSSSARGGCLLGVPSSTIP